MYIYKIHTIIYIVIYIVMTYVILYVEVKVYLLHYIHKNVYETILLFKRTRPTQRIRTSKGAARARVGTHISVCTRVPVCTFPLNKTQD